jgi:hypothetical protein
MAESHTSLAQRQRPVEGMRPPLPQALKGRNHLFSQISFYNTIDYAPLLGQGSLLGQGYTLSQLSKQVLPVRVYEAEASEDRVDEVEPRPNKDRLPFFVWRCHTLLIVGLSALFQFSINQINQINQTNQSSDNYGVIARSRQLKANKIHFQLSTFNFQLISGCFATLAMTTLIIMNYEL